MTHIAHLVTATSGHTPRLLVCDEHGTTATDMPLPAAHDPGRVDEDLHQTGWRRSAEWAMAKEGWLVPVDPT